MAEKTEVLIDVQVNTEQVTQKLANAMANVKALKDEQKDLNKQLQEGTITETQHAKAIAANKAALEQATRAVKSNTAILQAANTTVIDNTMSLDEQRQAINTLQKAYAGLDGDAKALADQQGGLRDQIKSATDMLKEQEHSIGDDRRNVGNYAESMEKAFKDIAGSAELLGSAASMLGQMGNEGKKAAVILSTIQKVMTFVAKAGKMQTEATQAQTVATGQATAAQNGLNAAMSANPIGIVITALTALLPLIQRFCDGSKEAEAAQAAFNLALAGTSRALKSIQTEYDMAAKMAAAMGESEQEVTRLKIEGAKKALEAADEAEQKAYEEYMSATKKKKEAAKEYYEEAQKRAKDAFDAYNAVLQAAVLQDTKARTQATEEAKRLAEERKEADIDAWMAAREQAEILSRMMVQDNKAAKKQIVADNEDEYEEDAKNLEEAYKKRKAFLAQFERETAESVRDIALAEADSLYADKLLTDEEYAKAREAIMDKYRQESLNADLEAAEFWANQAMSVLQAIGNAVAAHQNAELDEYEKANAQKKKDLENRLKAGLISQENYDNQVAAMDEELAKKQTEIEAQQAKQSKAFGIMEVAINTAMAIMRIWADVPKADFGAMTIALTAVAAALGAAQMAAIAAEPIPQFANGGYVPGNSYSGDRVLVRADSGEAVLTPQQQANFMDMANGNFAGGIDYDLLGATMAQAVAAQPAPVMDYSEFRQFEQNVSTFNEIAAI